MNWNPLLALLANLYLHLFLPLLIHWKEKNLTHVWPFNPSRGVFLYFVFDFLGICGKGIVHGERNKHIYLVLIICLHDAPTWVCTHLFSVGSVKLSKISFWNVVGSAFLVNCNNNGPQKVWVYVSLIYSQFLYSKDDSF